MKSEEEERRGERGGEGIERGGGIRNRGKKQKKELEIDRRNRKK